MNQKEIKTELRSKVHDFAVKIQPLYQWLGWYWAPGLNPKPYIPTVQNIEDSLHEKIDDLSGNSLAIKSGGLTVWIDKDNATAGIEFVVSEHVCW